MEYVEYSTVIPAEIHEVWSLFRDFNSLPEWHPLIESSKIESGKTGDQAGAVRSLELADSAGYAREKLLGISDEEHYHRYEVVESSLNTRNHRGRVQFFPVIDNNTTFSRWYARFDPPANQDDVTDYVREVFVSGLNALRDRWPSQ